MMGYPQRSVEAANVFGLHHADTVTSTIDPRSHHMSYC
jgi:hypothetical protein